MTLIFGCPLLVYDLRLIQKIYSRRTMLGILGPPWLILADPSWCCDKSLDFMLCNSQGFGTGCCGLWPLLNAPPVKSLGEKSNFFKVLWDLTCGKTLRYALTMQLYATTVTSRRVLFGHCSIERRSLWQAQKRGLKVQDTTRKPLRQMIAVLHHTFCSHWRPLILSQKVQRIFVAYGVATSFKPHKDSSKDPTLIERIRRDLWDSLWSIYF